MLMMQNKHIIVTEREGKTIGINVDLNIQRVYMYVMDLIREYKKVHTDDRSYSEILQYLFTEINSYLIHVSSVLMGVLLK